MDWIINFLIGAAVSVPVGWLLARWMASPGRCEECGKRIPIEPQTWICSYLGSSAKEVSLFYHEACADRLGDDELRRRREAAYEAA